MSRSRLERLDNVLLRRGLAPSLHEARALIMAGRVVVGEHTIDKPGSHVPESSPIRIKHRSDPYVSRGGRKLERPIILFSIPVSGAIVLDVGASTGGFTDCLLQHGAQLVYAVDVGYGQLAWKLQKDPRVVRYDKTHIGNLTARDLDPRPQIIVVDASFTSLKRLLPHVLTLGSTPTHILCLVKPQFELPRQIVPRGGIVRDPKRYQEVIQDVVLMIRGLGLRIIGIVESPVTGRKGNREFFIYAVTAVES